MNFISQMWNYAWLGGVLGCLMVMASAAKETTRRRYRAAVVLLVTLVLAGFSWTAKYDGLEQAAAVFVVAIIAWALAASYLRMAHWVMAGDKTDVDQYNIDDLLLEYCDERYRIVCPGCGTAGPWRYDKRDSVAAWVAGERFAVGMDELERAKRQSTPYPEEDHGQGSSGNAPGGGGDGGAAAV